MRAVRFRCDRAPASEKETVVTKGHTKIALRLALLALAAAALAVPAGAAREGAAGRQAELQRLLDRVVAGGVPGAVLLVREGDRTIRLASGDGNLKPRTPMRAGDRFRVGSITKAFVATVVLQLVGERNLALRDTVERWLPGIVPNGKRITVYQLLNHRSGLFDFGGDRKFVAAAFRDPMRDWKPRELVAIATRHKPYFAPGAGWRYSETNYYVLGLIVEAATRRSLAGELDRRIFAPLRLRATSFPSKPRIAGPHAHGYMRLGRPSLADVTVGSPSSEWAAGALVSNADDLARFFRALLGGRLLPPQLMRAMETVTPTPLGWSYGLGLMKVRNPCGALWGHTGATAGYSADALNSKDGGHQVVVLVNATGSLSGAGFFGPPTRAAHAIDRLIHTAYCG
jgi:D-alanyl-D-alanine carboxypeptidase